MQRAGPLHGQLYQGDAALDQEYRNMTRATRAGPSADATGQWYKHEFVRRGRNRSVLVTSLKLFGRLHHAGARSTVPAVHILHCQEGQRQAVLLHGCPRPQSVRHPALPSW
jgi:hypothetical protein